jgi:hypothetical protein
MSGRPDLRTGEAPVFSVDPDFIRKLPPDMFIHYCDPVEQ